MNPETPKNPRDELEARLTALLLGELSAGEAAAVCDAVAQNPELARLHQRLKQTIGLVRETVASPADKLAAKPDDLKLSVERREKLLEHFKASREPEAEPEVIVPRRRWQMQWRTALLNAAAVIALLALIVTVTLPNFVKSRTNAQRDYRFAKTDAAVADESLRKSHWFALGANPAPTTATPPPPAVEPPAPPPYELPAAPPLTAESKPQVLSVVVLPETAAEPAQTVVNFETRIPGTADDHLVRFGDASGPIVAQGGTAPATYGGFAGGGGRAGGSGGAAGSTDVNGAKRELTRVDRLSELRQNPGQPAAGEPASTLDLAAIVPSAPAERPMAGMALADLEDGRGKPPVSGPAAATKRAPAPARRPSASRALSERALGEGLVANEIEPAKAHDFSVVAANPVGRVELQGLSEFDATAPKLGVKLEKSLEAKKEPALRQKQVADQNRPAGEGELEQLGTIAGKPVALHFESKLIADTGRGNDNLGDAPALGRLFEKQRGDFDNGVVTTAKPASVSGARARANESSFGLNVVHGGDDAALLQKVDSLAASGIESHEFFANTAGVADRSAPLKEEVKDRVAGSTDHYFYGQISTDGERGGPSSLSLANGRDAATWDFSERFDTLGRIADKKTSGAETKSKTDTAKGAGVQAGGVYSVNAVGYVNIVTNAVSFDDFDRESDSRSSKFGRAQLQEESLARKQSEIALPQILSEEGRPVGERSAGRYIAGNLTTARNDEERLRRKLDSIRLHEFSSDSLPLGQVLEAINREAQTQDPDKKGINIVLTDGRTSTAAGTQRIEPTTGLPVSTTDHESTDLNAVIVKLTPMRNVTLGQALDAVAKAANRPLRLDIRKDGIVLSAKSEAAKANANEDVATRRPAPNTPIPQPEIRTGDNAFSTFSLNVSDVSFKLAAASLEKGAMPDAATVRSEEFINAFDYRDPEPTGAPIAFAWERARYPFAQNRDLLRLSVKTAAAGRQPGRPLNLVLLLDNSGSMERADRVRIIQQCLRVLAGQLRAEDRLSVVTFARTPRLWKDGIPGNQAAQVAEEVGGLTPQGGTNLEEAMNLAYQTAQRHYLANGVNRVVLLTDGAANLGDVRPETLQKKVESFRKQGVALDCFGIGWDGYNDDLLEVLSRNGDGRYGFVNTPEAAYVEFAGQLAGALKVAASDVKVQVEFNPKRVTAYRQIGYAKHQLKKEQFRDNTVDAAEIGAAEAGNAIYVIEVNPRGEGPLAVVRVRFKVPGTSDYREHEWTVPFTGPAVALDNASPAMRLAATASAFSEWLVASPFAAEVTPDALLNQMRGVPEVFGADARPKKLEWMIRQAKSVAGR